MHTAGLTLRSPDRTRNLQGFMPNAWVATLSTGLCVRPFKGGAPRSRPDNGQRRKQVVVGPYQLPVRLPPGRP